MLDWIYLICGVNDEWLYYNNCEQFEWVSVCCQDVWRCGIQDRRIRWPAWNLQKERPRGTAGQWLLVSTMLPCTDESLLWCSTLSFLQILIQQGYTAEENISIFQIIANGLNIESGYINAFSSYSNNGVTYIACYSRMHSTNAL